MPISGKYNFAGFQKLGTLAIQAALAKQPWAVAIAKVPILGSLLKLVPGLVTNWAANQGLVILNIGYNYVDGEIDQKALDKALEEGLAHLEIGRENVDPVKGAMIDEEVRKAARKFIPYSSKP